MCKTQSAEGGLYFNTLAQVEDQEYFNLISSPRPVYTPTFPCLLGRYGWPRAAHMGGFFLSLVPTEWAGPLQTLSRTS